MKMTKKVLDGVDVIHVDEDRIDASVAIQFKDRFRALISDGRGPVVLDLSHVVFLDSSGLGAVVAARKLLGEERLLALSGLNPAVDKVMQLTRMNTIFPIHSDVPTALTQHRAKPAA
ncbi:MAG: anti-sigma B factor antagonist [Paracoccaceae bacterium]|jgi:anti-sigma B factor antagonist